MVPESGTNPLDELDILPEEAMQQLIICYTPMIYRIAGRYLQTDADIQDVVNDTFAEIYLCRKAYDPARSSLATWIGTIARNIAVSIYRKNRDLLHYDGNAPGVQSVPDFAEYIQKVIDLEKVICQLNETDQRIVRMRYYGNMTLAAIAEDMDLPYETVKKRHTRLMCRLRRMLSRPD